jgi:hypothetical protein
MSLSYFVFTGLVLALLLKRDPISIIKNVSFKVPLLMIGCLFVQIGLELSALQFNKQFPIILYLTFLGMLCGLFFNRHIRGITWIFIGTSINSLALLTHKGLMPVSETAINLAGLQHLLNYNRDSRHQQMEDSLFWWLGDWIPFFAPIGENFILSPGDLIIGIGLILFCVRNSAKRSLQR